MPQSFLTKGKGVTISGHFVDFRRCPLLRWVPYWTGNRPKIRLSVKASSPIKRIIVKHRRPDGRYTPYDMGDATTAFEHTFESDILSEAGIHSYSVGVQMANGAEREGPLLTTGKVFWWDELVRNAVFVIGALIVGGLIDRLVIP